MKWCVQFPEETILIIRPCLVAICMGNRPAAKLLNALLYRYSIRKESKDDAENINENKQARGQTPSQDTSYRIYRKQSQLVDDMCGEMTEKTLHDVAVPALQLLGYLDIEEDMKANCYIVNVDKVTEALNQYNPSEGFSSRLEEFLISSLRLEEFLISSDEKVDRKNFQSRLEKVLIWNRNSSNYHRGRKPSPEAASKGKSKTPRLVRDIREKESNKESSPVPPIEPDSPSIPSLIPSSSKQRDTEPLPPSKGISEEEARIDGYWQELGFLSKPTAKEHWLTLSGHIKSFEQFKSLYEYTRSAVKDKKDKRVYPGNLVDHLDGWKQKQTPAAEPEKKVRSSVDPLTKYKSIGAQFINQGVN